MSAGQRCGSTGDREVWGRQERKGFTPETLKEIPYQSAYDLDEYNPRYTGQLGHGCVDATAALKIDVSNLHPFTLKSNQVTDNTLIFSVSSSMALFDHQRFRVNHRQESSAAPGLAR